jgi:hypothetical protein
MFEVWKFDLIAVGKLDFSALICGTCGKNFSRALVVKRWNFDVGFCLDVQSCKSGNMISRHGNWKLDFRN